MCLTSSGFAFLKKLGRFLLLIAVAWQHHVAAALFRVEAAIIMGLSNPSCTSRPCQWLPNSKTVRPLRVKDLKLSRGDFGRRGKKLQELNCSPKKIPSLWKQKKTDVFKCCPERNLPRRGVNLFYSSSKRGQTRGQKGINKTMDIG